MLETNKETDSGAMEEETDYYRSTLDKLEIRKDGDIMDIVLVCIGCYLSKQSIQSRWLVFANGMRICQFLHAGSLYDLF